MAIQGAGRAVLVWVMGFLAWHVVWVLTGLSVPDGGHQHGAARVAVYVFTVVVWVMTVVGVLTPLAMMRDWRWFSRRLQLGACWVGCLILALRGGSGVLDDVVRWLGVLPRGLSGLSTAQVYGSADPSWWAYTASTFTDVLFVSGGVVFAVAVRALRRPVSVRGDVLVAE